MKRLNHQEFKEGETLSDRTILLVDICSGNGAYGSTDDRTKIEFNLARISDVPGELSEARRQGRRFTSLFPAGRYVILYQQDTDGALQQMCFHDCRVPFPPPGVATPIYSERVDAGVASLAAARVTMLKKEDDCYELSADLNPR